MSASPPPPPFPQQGPIPNAPWDRATLRAQRRLATQQARQQRAVYRAQMRAVRRSSIVGPLLLIALGVLFLLVQTGRLHWDTLIDGFAHWWPLTLVVAGVILLAEWAIDSIFARDHGLAMPRRTLGGGTVSLLVLLAIAGALTMSVETSSAWIQRSLEDNFDQGNALGLQQILGPRSETTLDLNAPLAKDGLLTIQNPRGSITVTGASSDAEVHATIHQRVYAWHSSELHSRREREQPRLTPDGSGLLLSVPSEGRDEADLTLQIPHNSALRIRQGHGEVNVSELHGSLTIDGHDGNIALTALTGPVQLEVRDDNATISGHSLSGSLTLQGRSGDLTFSDISGPVSLRGDFFGTTHLERIRGAVHFQSSYTDFACTGIPGELNIEGRSDLQAHNIDGPVTLATTDRNLTLTGIRGGATITNRNGSVTLSLLDPIGPVHVTTTDGSVELRLPEKAAFVLSAQTADGQVNNEFGLRSQEAEDHTTLSGQVRSGGPLMTLQTSEGDVSVRKATADDWADDDSPDQTAPKTAKASPPEAHAKRIVSTH